MYSKDISDGYVSQNKGGARKTVVYITGLVLAICAITVYSCHSTSKETQLVETDWAPQQDDDNHTEPAVHMKFEFEGREDNNLAADYEDLQARARLLRSLIGGLTSALDTKTDQINNAIAARDAAAAAAAPVATNVTEPSTPQEIDEAEDTWTSFGQDVNNGDGSWNLNGNPGAINNFVRCDNQKQRPLWVSATFDGGFKYPMVEFVPDLYDSGAPDVGVGRGIYSYQPTNNGQFTGHNMASFDFTFDPAQEITVSFFAMLNGTTVYTVENGGNSNSFWYDLELTLATGYVYVFNQAGNDVMSARNLRVGPAPDVDGDVQDSGNSTEVEVEQQDAAWTGYGDVSDNGDGSWRLNGNPGSVGDFVRTDDSWDRPVFASVTFDAGWETFYPLIEFVPNELTFSIPDIGGLSNYKPQSGVGYFHGNQHSEQLGFTPDSTQPVTLQLYAMEDGSTNFTVINGNNTYTYTDTDGNDITSGYIYISNRAGSLDMTARDFEVGHAPYTDDEIANGDEQAFDDTTTTVTNVTTPDASWECYGDDASTDQSNGSYSLNGNPGAINNFVRSGISWNLPVYVEATFSQVDSLYPTLELIADEYTSGVPQIHGLSNYKPSTSGGNFFGNAHQPAFNLTIDTTQDVTMSVYVQADGTVTYGVSQGDISQTFDFAGEATESGYYAYIFNYAGSSVESVHDLYIGSGPPEAATTEVTSSGDSTVSFPGGG